jgi:hypothetical protein
VGDSINKFKKDSDKEKWPTRYQSTQ